MLISTNVFTKAIFTVTGKDMAVFIDQWVRTGGHAKFSLSFVFNRKRYLSFSFRTIYAHRVIAFLLPFVQKSKRDVYMYFSFFLETQ